MSEGGKDEDAILARLGLGYRIWFFFSSSFFLAMGMGMDEWMLGFYLVRVSRRKRRSSRERRESIYGLIAR